MSTTAAVPLPTPASLPPLPPLESAKRLAAYRAVDTHFPPPNPSTPTIIGIGSGSTVIYVVERIAQLPRSQLSQYIFIPTGYQSRQLILAASLPLGDIDAYPRLTVAFDGADEVDPSLNCIKGGGACLFQEKLVAIKAAKFVVVADARKISPSLSTAYARGVPIEVVPPAASYVLEAVARLGAVGAALRMGGSQKAGPVVTDNGNFIVDAPFPDGVEIAGLSVAGTIGQGVGRSEVVGALAQNLKSLVGVVEHGIFWAGDKKPVVAYFGMEDGSVSVRGQE